MRTIWCIGPSDMVDNFSAPEALPDVAWVVGQSGQKWPRFHPSEADPDAGYKQYPFSITFSLDGRLEGALCLRISYLSIAPRIADLQVNVNGRVGRLYLRPAPEADGQIRVPAGLHTSIYTSGTAEALIPASYLQPGANVITLTAIDGGDVLRVSGKERILRLDRMADSAGFIYDGIELAGQLPGRTEAVVGCSLEPSILYRRDPSGEVQQVCDIYLDMGRATEGGTLDVRVEDSRMSLTIPATQLGTVHHELLLPDGAGHLDWEVWGQLDGDQISFSGSSRRPRKWTVYVAPHAHTDIGYTHRQWEVAERQAMNIDRAIDMMKDRDFAFHLDSSWPLEHYMATRSPGRVERLLNLARESKVGIAASYADLLTQYAALEDLIRNGELTQDFLRRVDAHSDFTAVVDVASITGSLPSILQGQGVRYLVHANNQDRGPFRSFSGLHRVAPYYWEGTHGGRVLVWLSKAYCELRKVCGSPPTLFSGARGMSQWLQEYERDDYEPDSVLMYGQEADNTDIDPQPADFVERWNSVYAFPRLIFSSVSDFFQRVEKEFGPVLKTVRGDGGAYWEDGVGSSIAPSIAVRRAQAALPAAEILESLAVAGHPQLAFPHDHYAEAWRQVLLYDEHTWGSAMSMGDPESWITGDQWAIKEHIAHDAEQWATRLLHGAAVRHSLQWNTEGREVVVYNPHTWEVSGPAAVEFGRWERAVDPESGVPAAVRQLHVSTTQQQVEIWVDRLPGLAFRRYVLEPAPPAPARARPAPLLENARYRLEVDPEAGCVRSWRDKTLDRELVDGSGGGLGQFVYVRGGEGTRLTNNRTDLPPADPQVVREFLLRDWTAEESSLGQTVRLHGDVPAGSLDVEWLLPRDADWIGVHLTYHKSSVDEREAVYVAFPLGMPDAAVLSDSQLGWVDWHRDELPGGSKEWLPLQSSILVRGDDSDVLICSPDIPLFCVGDVVRGLWPVERDLRGGRLFSYVLNNYWHTNYKARQGGEVSFSYRLMSDRSISLERAFRAGKEARRPPYAHRISFQDFRSPQEPYGRTEGKLASLTPDSVVLSTLKPARRGEGWIVRLQEVAGSDQDARVEFSRARVARAITCDLLDQDVGTVPVHEDGSVRAQVPAWGIRSLRLVLEGE